MKTFIAVIIAFFQAIFGIGSADIEKPEIPEPTTPSYVEDADVLEVGDYLTVETDSNISATARIIQTNGNRFTVEFNVKADPNINILIIDGEAAYNFSIPEEGTLDVTIKTQTVNFKVAAL